MLKPKEMLVKIGPQHLGKGVSYVLAELDNVLPDWPVKPSLIGNIGLTIAGCLGGFFAPEPLDEILVIWGGHHSTNLWDYLRTGIAPPPTARLSSNPRLVPTRGLAKPVDIAHRKVEVGPYAGGAGAPKFIPGVLRPKFTHGS